jgi:hypothetical protein
LYAAFELEGYHSGSLNRAIQKQHDKEHDDEDTAF